MLQAPQIFASFASYTYTQSCQTIFQCGGSPIWEHDSHSYSQLCTAAGGYVPKWKVEAHLRQGVSAQHLGYLDSLLLLCRTQLLKDESGCSWTKTGLRRQLHPNGICL